MCNGVMLAFTDIEAATDDVTITDDDGANRYLSRTCRFSGEGEGFVHEVPVHHLVRPRGFEPLTCGFVDHRSIQLSYGRRLFRIANKSQ